ncbi:hypothetical protein [Aurantivibrio infirmus]
MNATLYSLSEAIEKINQELRLNLEIRHLYDFAIEDKISFCFKYGAEIYFLDGDTPAQLNPSNTLSRNSVGVSSVYLSPEDAIGGETVGDFYVTHVEISREQLMVEKTHLQWFIDNMKNPSLQKLNELFATASFIRNMRNYNSAIKWGELFDLHMARMNRIELSYEATFNELNNSNDPPSNLPSSHHALRRWIREARKFEKIALNSINL